MGKTMDADPASETECAGRSTQSGAPVDKFAPGAMRYVPSWYAKTGYTVAEAATSLGLRVLSRSEIRAGAIPTAEIHERSNPHSYWCVPLRERFASLRDITPSRATILALGDFDECEAAIEKDGDGTCRIAVVYVGEPPEIGERVWVTVDDDNRLCVTGRE